MADISVTCAALKAAADDAKTAFGSLSVDQLNWKPAEKSWSVAQCLDHLIVTHSLYFPIFEKLAAADVRQTFWERVSPLSGFFGRSLIRSLDPGNVKPMKTATRAFPSSSEIGADIVGRFVEHQSRLVDCLQKLPYDIDARKTIITSPLFSLVTYSLDDTFTIMTHHCRRHIDQAKRVTGSEGFPAK
jgi:hypothetical protein